MNFASFHRLICALLLVVYTAMGTQVVAALAVVVAEWDGGHSVSILVSDQGTKVVLTHGIRAFTPKPKDHESALLRAVVSLGQNDANGDHQIITNQISSLSNPGHESETIDAQTLEPQMELEPTFITLNPQLTFNSAMEKLRIQGQGLVSGIRDTTRSSLATVQLVV